MQFDEALNCWVPRDDCGQHPLPNSLPPEAAVFVRNRQQLRDVRVHDIEGMATPYVSESGFMEGPQCIPRIPNDSCRACGNDWKASTSTSDGMFLLRTYGGAVIREKRALVCACGERVKWRPAEEFIHTIRNETEGGKCNWFYCS